MHVPVMQVGHVSMGVCRSVMPMLVEVPEGRRKTGMFMVVVSIIVPVSVRVDEVLVHMGVLMSIQERKHHSEGEEQASLDLDQAEWFIQQGHRECGTDERRACECCLRTSSAYLLGR